MLKLASLDEAGPQGESESKITNLDGGYEIIITGLPQFNS